MASKKVLIAHVPYFYRGGEDRYVEMLKNAYESLGYEVYFEPESRSAPETYLKPALCSFLPSVITKPSWLSRLHKIKPHFIHLNNAFPLLGPSFFSAIFEYQLKLIMTVHNHRFFCTNGLALRHFKPCYDCFSNKDKKVSLLKPLFYNCNGEFKKSLYHTLSMALMNKKNLYSKSVRLFLAPSPYIKDLLIRWGIEPSRVHLLFNPVDVSISGSMDSKRIHQTDVFYAGRLSFEKGILNLLKLIELNQDIQFVIAGKGDLAALVEEKSKEFKNLRYFSDFSHDEVLLQIQKSKLGILPSICNEILPTFVLECFLSSKPCMIPDLDSTRWLSEKNFDGYGFLADTQSVESMSKVVRMALNQNEQNFKKTNFFSEQFSLKKFTNELGQMVESVL